jgi:hypothetical protein
VPSTLILTRLLSKATSPAMATLDHEVVLAGLPGLSPEVGSATSVPSSTPGPPGPSATGRDAWADRRRGARAAHPREAGAGRQVTAAWNLLAIEECEGFARGDRFSIVNPLCGDGSAMSTSGSADTVRSAGAIGRDHLDGRRAVPRA